MNEQPENIATDNHTNKENYLSNETKHPLCPRSITMNNVLLLLLLLDYVITLY